MPVLATKLFPPRARGDLIDRPRLLAGMAGPARCTLLSAPAGAGKTTLLSAWLADRDRPVAWLSLDERDQDVRRFVRYLVSAVQMLDPACGATALAWLDGPPTPSEVVLTSLVNDVAALPEGSVLVLDDYHLVRSAAVHHAVVFLLEHLPPSLRLVLATREDPPFPLARLRGRGELVEIRAADLAFGVDEASGLLVGRSGLRLTRSQVSALVERTEGWAAGLQLAGLALRNHPDPGGFVAAFAGSHRLVADYLTAEVLDRQPPATRRFLLATSLLGRMCAPLCDAVLGGGSEAQVTLEELERANLFVVPLDDQRRWYRYHHLFAEVLRSRQHSAPGGAAAEAHRRASDWFGAHGLLPEAIEHALAAGAVEDAADRIESLVPALFANLDLNDVMSGWLSALPEPLVRTRPSLCAAMAWLLLHKYRLHEAAVWTAAADRPSTQPTARPSGAVAALQALLATLGETPPQDARVLAERALATLRPADGPFRSLGGIALGQAALAEGDPSKAERAFADAAAAAQDAGLDHLAQLAVTHEVCVQRIVGARLRAMRTARAAAAWAAEHGSPIVPGLGLLSVQLAELEHDGNNVAAARAMAAEGLEVLRKIPERRVLILLAGLTLARVCVADGDPAAADAVLAQARPLTRDEPFAGLAPLLDAAEAQTRVARGAAEAAVDWALVAPAGPPEFYRYETHVFAAWLEALHLTPAQILTGQGRVRGDAAWLEQALARLERTGELAEQRGLGAVRIEVLVLRALALDGLGDRDGAMEALVTAVASAVPQGIVRPFVDGGASMAALLAAARVRASHLKDPTGRLRGGLDALLAAVGPTAGRRVPHRPLIRGLGGTLTARECDVLRLLLDGRSTAEIARALFVEQSTVKTHLGHLYRKLGVRGRSQALARARELQLLQA